jgi:hypothetical protein
MHLVRLPIDSDLLALRFYLQNNLQKKILALDFLQVIVLKLQLKI